MPQFVSHYGGTTRRFPLRLWLLYLVCALLAWDLGLRIRWKQLIPSAGIEQPHFHHRLLPNTAYHYTSSEFDVTVRTNRYGLRGPDPAMPKPPGTVRLLLLGDSYIFGFPVRDEETAAVLIQRTLTRQGDPVEVINGGVSGYSPTLHYLSLRDQFLAFEPDVVVLWYDLGDLMEDAAFQKNLVYDGAGRIVRCDPRYVNGRFSTWKWLQDHSALMKYLNTKVVRTAMKIQVLGLRGYVNIILTGERAKVAMARVKRRQLAPDLATYDKFLLVREDSTPEVLAPYWRLSERYLLMIRDLLKARGIPLLIGVYPYGMLIGGEQWSEGRVFWGFQKGRTYSAAAFLGLITAFTTREGVPLINTFPGFQEAARTQTLCYPEDGHFTPAGQRVLAEQLLRDPTFLATLRSRLHPIPTRLNAGGRPR